MKTVTALMLLALSFCVQSDIDYSTYSLTPEQEKDINEQYFKSTDEVLQNYFEPVVYPENYDRNKDGQISRKEFTEALSFVLFQRKERELADKNKPAYELAQKRIKVFANALPSFINYNAFKRLIAEVDPHKFVDSNLLSIQKVKEELGSEIEIEL